MHPRQVLLGAQAGAVGLPVCDHYSGVEARMVKSLALQKAYAERLGACVFDVTLDLEDGAPAGREAQHAALVADLVAGLDFAAPVPPRAGVRVHAVDHPAFESDVKLVVGSVAPRLAYVMVPKVESPEDVLRAVAAVNAVGASSLPLHVLIESPYAVHRAFEIAAHPRVQSLSFGLMDFVSAHAGAIPADGMGVSGQFSHPLVLRAKLDVASACHAHGKVPSHCVVTEFKDRDAVKQAAVQASGQLGYTRMWSIHPDQIDPILAAFAPTASEVAEASDIVLAAAAADWGPIAHAGRLHDRASYRYYWQVVERAHQTGVALPTALSPYFEPGPR